MRLKMVQFKNIDEQFDSVLNVPKEKCMTLSRVKY